MSACAPSDATTSSLGRLVDYVTCNAPGIGAVSAAQHTPLAAPILGAALTLYVALIGYQLMLGRAYDPRAAALSALRVGLVIALCTSWSGYGVLVERVALEGPFELASAILPSSSPALSRPARTAERLQALYDQIRTGVRHAPGEGAPGPDAQSSRGQTPQAPTAERPPPPPTSTFESQTGQSLLLSGVGTYLAMRVAAGLLLAVGPLLIPLALFDVTLGLVEGWVRALVGVTLGAASAIVISAYELDFLQAELARALPGDPAALDERGLQSIVLVFGAAGWITAVAFAVVAMGFRPRWFRLPPLGTLTMEKGQPEGEDLPSRAPVADRSTAAPSRAQALAGAIVDQGRMQRAAGAARGAPATPREASTADQASPPNHGYANALGMRRAPRLGLTTSVASRERRR